MRGHGKLWLRYLDIPGTLWNKPDNLIVVFTYLVKEKKRVRVLHVCWLSTEDKGHSKEMDEMMQKKNGIRIVSD